MNHPIKWLAVFAVTLAITALLTPGKAEARRVVLVTPGVVAAPVAAPVYAPVVYSTNYRQAYAQPYYNYYYYRPYPLWAPPARAWIDVAPPVVPTVVVPAPAVVPYP
jgi:hypothetical protein